LPLATAEPQFRRAKETVDDQGVLVDADVGNLGVSVRADDEDGRHLALHDPAWKLDNQGLAKVMSSGTLANIMAKYGFGPTENVPPGLTTSQLCGAAN
jgi:polar amino acid transport system substrate-binding protein